ncbi:MAG: DeoR/GlpR family DNA-binding transcription regulator [Acidocella sp.]|nr:DeoR/GlpR family DNA-binding transcription regulator [Acidocella sp.]MDR3718966.1 DeoR/GlpR family DNA-binding transcription regulator [Bryobacteraceae bacterium]
MSLKRQADILQAVRETGSASITELATRLDVSTETIRRNIKPLIEQGSVLRFHGGIMSPEQMADPPFQRRMQLNQAGKRQVASLVLDMVRDGDSLILDNGTTTTYVAEALAARSNLVVVTNSAQIACRLASRNNNRVFMTGGELGGDDAAAFGPSSIEFVKQFEVRYALLSVAGINARGELVDFHLFEAEFSRAAMAQAEETWVIADQSKFGREAPVKVCEWGKVQKIITDAPPPEEFIARCAATGVRIVTG